MGEVYIPPLEEALAQAKDFEESLRKFKTDIGIPSDTQNIILNAIKSSIENSLKALIQYVQDVKTAIEQQDFTKAITLILQISIPSLICFIIVDMLSVKVLGVGFEFEGIKKFLNTIFRVDLFVSAVVGALVGAGVKSPAEQIANAIFRPSIPSVSTALSMYIKGLITKDELVDLLARNGIPTKYFDKILSDYSRPPSIYDLRRIYQISEISDDKVKQILKENLVYDEYYINLFMRYLKAERLREEFSAYQSFLKSAYLDGLITEEYLESELRKFKASREEIDVLIIDLKNMLSRQLTKMEVETLTWYYRKGLIDENTFYSKLISLGVKSEVANAIVRLEASKKGIVFP